MKLIAAIALAAAAFASFGCGTTKAPPVVTAIEHAVDCNEAAVKAQLPSIVSEVTTDLLQGNYDELLNKLAQREGDDAVVCAVRVASEAAAARQVESGGDSPNGAIVSGNAGAYLKLRGVHFVSSPSPASFWPGVSRGTWPVQASGPQPRTETYIMGTWAIKIEGHGIHDNKKTEDANVMAANFVEQLRAVGHEVSSATFQVTPSGDTVDVSEVEKYLAENGPTEV